MKVADPSGRIRLFLCSVVLFVNHGLRDYLITGLPTIASLPEDSPELSDFLHEEISIAEDHIRFLSTGFVSRSSNNGSEVHLVLNSEEGWTNALIGGTLSSIHWGWLIPLVASPFVIPRVPIKYLLVCSLVTSGILSLFMELAGKAKASNIIILRILQGLLQGWCYPIVFYILDDIEMTNYAVSFFMVFIAPWFGSGVGALLGWAKDPYTGAYTFGALSIFVGILTLFISLELRETEEKPKNVWWECLTSAPVWACILLQLGTVWILHLFLIGLAFTLDFKLNRSDLIWSVFVVIMLGGIIARLVAMAAMSLLRIHFISPLNRRRSVIALGFTIIIISLIVIGISGVNSEHVLVGMAVIGLAGVGICLVGIRLNLHDLGPLFPVPFLIFGSAASSVGAAMSSLLFPIIAQIGDILLGISIDDINDSSWRAAWMVPMVVIFVVCVIHLFLVSVIPLPHQTLIIINKEPQDIQMNGMSASRDEFDAKSFKSVKSALSFKSAVSRQRTRTASFKTVDEDNIDIDLQTLPDSTGGEDCISIAEDDQIGNQDMKSIRSGTASFKSTVETRLNSVAGEEYGVVLNVQDLDRTSAWLSTYHNSGGKHDKNSSEKEKIEKNLLFGIQW